MNKKVINPRGGMTLIEVVAAMGIIAICAVMLWTGYRATSAIMRHSADKARAADAAFALAQTYDTDGTSGAAANEAGSVSFRAGERLYTVEGHFTRGESGDFVFCAFTPIGGAP